MYNKRNYTRWMFLLSALLCLRLWLTELHNLLYHSLCSVSKVLTLLNFILQHVVAFPQKVLPVCRYLKVQAVLQVSQVHPRLVHSVIQLFNHWPTFLCSGQQLLQFLVSLHQLTLILCPLGKTAHIISNILQISELRTNAACNSNGCVDLVLHFSISPFKK